MMNDFFAADQLLSTLTIGFVILGYSKFFTDILKTKFFHADDKIKSVCDECKSMIPDKMTRDNLVPVTVGSGSTAAQIEQLKRSCEKIEESISDLDTDAKNKLNKKSELHGLTSSCLFVFLFSVSILFLPGLRTIIPAQFNVFVFSFSSLCIIYTIAGEVFGELEIKKVSSWFSSMSKTVYGFLIIVLLSAVSALLTIWFEIAVGDAWKYLYVALIIVGWLNFVVYVFIIRHRIKSFKTEIDEQKETILSECRTVKNSYDELRTVARVANQFDSN